MKKKKKPNADIGIFSDFRKISTSVTNDDPDRMNLTGIKGQTPSKSPTVPWRENLWNRK